jgi:uncharacterized protein (DUF983 family)
MSGYAASCPACGASLVFALGTSRMKVCDHCGVAVARKGANLETYGRVADLIPTPSVLALGVEGGYEGAPGFRLVGRLQIDHGTGTWDEWLMGFDDGAWAWLSESQGKFHYMGAAALPPVPEFEDVRPGQTIDLGPPGVFVVTEARAGRFVSAQGELPFDAPPGSELHYADLSGPGGQFATIDYGQGSEAEALYVGREVSLDEIGARGLPDQEERRARAAGQQLSCPQCGGPLELRAPDLTQRIACPWCGSLLDATQNLKVLAALAAPPIEALIPLGSQGTLEGVNWSVIGLMERSVTFEEVRYPWREYLLYEPRHGFRWLVESSGHWSFVEPAHAGDVTGGYTPSYQGQRFKHFQSGRARVDAVIGEFYWAVAQGDETDTADFVAPPLMLSKEESGEEITWSRGAYQDARELWRAFGAPGEPPRAEGVGANQPWPRKRDARAIYLASFLALGALCVLYLGFLIFGGRRVYQREFEIPSTARSGTPEAAVFSEPFEIPSHGNVEIKVTAPVSNSWLYLEGALINEATGALDEFDAEVSYYFGSDSDGSWTEGGTSSRRYVAGVPPGRYLLRLEPQWEAGKPPPSRFVVAVRSRVPRFYQFFLAALALGAWPLLTLWRQLRFEIERWSQSDHPWVTSGE